MDKIFNKPFAINGARVAIPENGTENERVSFDKGFTQPYEVEAPSVDNPAGQGFNILRPEMNEALYQLSSACNLLAENIDKWIALTTENLNNITQKGRYFQAVQSQATNDNNYPTNEMGYLIVFDSINNNVTQFYKTATTGQTFYRYKIGSAWGEWIENLTTDNGYTKSEVYTKAEVNNLLNQKSGLGVGQTWQDVKSSREFNTEYTNNTGKPIQLAIGLTGNTGQATLKVNNIIVGDRGSYQGHFFAIIPNGSKYKLEKSGGSATIYNWAELR